MPKVTPEAYEWLALWADCKRWNALPAAGGIGDQDEETMAILGRIDEEAAAARERAEERRAERARREGR